MHFLKTKEELFHLFAQGTTVLTPNNRLSESIVQLYFKHCNEKTIEKPRCMPYGVALIKAYEQLKFSTPKHNHPGLLQNVQCQHLWRKIITSESNITYSEGLLQKVLNAWEHCLQWQINPENPTFNYTAQTRQFQLWWQTFNQKLKQLELIAKHQLVPYLLNANSLLFSQAVIWLCFDDFNPQQQSLQHHLTQNGLTQYRYDLNKQSATAQILAAKDQKEEYQQLMAWLNLKLQQGNQHIGVVVPDLEQELRPLHRELTKHFDPALFNISLGQALSEFPLVSHALCWLNLDDKQLNHHQVTLLLQSPYIACAQEEFINRSEYLQDGTLMENQIIPLKALLHELNATAPKLAELLTKITPYPTQASPQEWIDLFYERLNSLGFPGDYGLSSENYQCLNRFTELFDELRQLALVTESLSRNEALDALRYLSDNTIFQAQKTSASIQISGLLEASGCEFDSLWVMGLTFQCLPQKVRLSAFIPPQLQCQLLMPHSDPSRELQFARQTLQRMQKSANSIVLSYAKLQGDNPQLPCPLITDLPDFALLPIHTAQLQNTDLVSFAEDYNIPIKSAEHISGGTAILSNQAKCPFKAFAEHRLRAKPSLQTSDGLDNKERGQIIHKVMELLWQALGSQQNLFTLNTNQLEQQIEKAIRTALTPLKQRHPHLIQEVEYIRLKRLVLTCLEWEKQRPPFTIAALEQSYSINLSGLEVKVRVDRLDQVANKKWVIDYKSSLPTSKPWNEDRPKEPQLLLYTLLDEQINTLLFLQLKTGQLGCSGLSEEKQRVRGITAIKKEERWDDCRDSWQQQLTHLADEFQQGHCPPQPAHLTICQQCDFQNLCRFQPNFGS